MSHIIAAISRPSSEPLDYCHTPLRGDDICRVPSRRRRGAVLIVVLVCLMMATAMFILVVRQALAERRAIEMSRSGLQSTWLAEAGIERAVARLAADPKYAGETWAISAAELAAGDGAVVKIEVKAIAGRPEQRSVRAQADYPDAAERRCRQVKQIVVDRD